MFCILRSTDVFFHGLWLPCLALEDLHIGGALLRGAGWNSQYPQHCMYSPHESLISLFGSFLMAEGGIETLQAQAVGY